MTYKTIYHKLVSGENVKFTIQEKYIDGEKIYSAKVINVDLDLYKDLNEFEKSTYLGVNVTNGRQSTVFYKDPKRLEKDILENYGINWLESEI